MRNLFTLLSFLVLATSLNAQKNDPNAKKILDAVSAKFKSFKTVTANFKYKVENADGKTLSSKTGVLSMKGAKYKIKFGEQEIFSNGNTIWNYDKTANEVTISTMENSATTLTPQKLFTNFYDKDFLYMLNGEKTTGGVVVQEIELTPTDKTRPYHKIYLTINKKTNTIISTKILENGGNRYTYYVSTLTPNKVMADNSFTFDKAKFPTAELVDLR